MDLKEQSLQEKVITWNTDSHSETDQLFIENESTASSCDDTEELADGQPLVEGQPLRILLTGLTGSGKSATGNTLLGEKRFKHKRSPESVTTECQLEKGYNAGRLVQILDTPGLFDTQLSDEESATFIVESATHLAPGPHIIAFTINVMFKFDEKSKHAFERMTFLLGPDAPDHAVVVFTHADQLDESIEDFINESPALKTLLDECGQRYVTFNNKSDDKMQMKRFFNVADRQFGKAFLKIKKYNSDEIAKKVEEADKREVSKRPYVAKLERTTAHEVEARLKAENDRNHAEKKALEEKSAKEKAKREEEYRKLAEKKALEERENKKRAEKNARRKIEERQRAEDLTQIAIEDAQREQQARIKAERKNAETEQGEKDTKSHDEQIEKIKEIPKRKEMQGAFEAATVTAAVRCAFIGILAGSAVFVSLTVASQLADHYFTPSSLDDTAEQQDTKKGKCQNRLSGASREHTDV